MPTLASERGDAKEAPSGSVLTFKAPET